MKTPEEIPRPTPRRSEAAQEGRTRATAPQVSEGLLVCASSLGRGWPAWVSLNTTGLPWGLILFLQFLQCGSQQDEGPSPASQAKDAPASSWHLTLTSKLQWATKYNNQNEQMKWKVKSLPLLGWPQMATSLVTRRNHAMWAITPLLPSGSLGLSVMMSKLMPNVTL